MHSFRKLVKGQLLAFATGVVLAQSMCVFLLIHPT